MIHPQAIIEPGVELGVDCEIAAFAVIKKGTVLGDRVVVDHHAVVGGLPQDKQFDPAVPSTVVIGSDVVIREGVTVHRSTIKGGATRVSDGVYLMANSHIGHDCSIGEHTIVANAVLIAGHVEIGSHCFLGGGAAVHQFVRMGEGVVLSGLSRLSLDAAPFIMVSERNEVSGLNQVGLSRRSFSEETVRDLKQCFRAVYRSENKNLKKNAAVHCAQTEKGQLFLNFFSAESKRGFCPARRG